MKSPSPSKKDAERERLAEYWQKERIGVVERLALVRERDLDRERTLSNDACFAVGLGLIRDFIELAMVDEDEVAAKVLNTAEFYFVTAIERDDLGAFGRGGQEELGRAERLKGLTIVRWLRDRKLDQVAFRQALELKERWNNQAFSQKNWRETDFGLDEWMAELIVAGDYVGALSIYQRYFDQEPSVLRSKRTPEETLALVASALARPEDGQRRREAEAALDGFYRKLTAWMEPKLRMPDVLPDEKFLYAYVRGKHFKGEEDPVRIIKRMKWGE